MRACVRGHVRIRECSKREIVLEERERERKFFKKETEGEKEQASEQERERESTGRKTTPAIS